jgi:prophage antirepressor-like protein
MTTKNTISPTEGIRGNPTRVIVNEFGLYCLIIRPDKPQSKAFRKWITSEVLPSIHRTGSYAPDETQQIERFLKDPARATDLLRHYAETNLKLIEENESMQLKVQALHNGAQGAHPKRWARRK